MRAYAVLLVAVVLSAVPATAAAETSLSGMRSAGLRPSDAAALADGLGAGRPQARALLSDAAGTTDVAVRTHRRPRWTSYTYFRDGRVLLSFSRAHLHGIGVRARDQTIWHEVGHVVDLLFVTPSAERVFRDAFSASANWRPCFSYAGRCLDEGEVFAEQFAYWATGDRRSHSSYRIPALVGPVTFGRLLAAERSAQPWWLRAG